MNITTIGIDLTKNVFQIHGVDARGKVVVKKALKRVQVLPFFVNLTPCLIFPPGTKPPRRAAA